MAARKIAHIDIRESCPSPPVAVYLTWEDRPTKGKGVSPSLSVELKLEQLLVGEDWAERALTAQAVIQIGNFVCWQV